MAIEANIDVIMERASRLSSAAREIEAEMVSFKRARAYLDGIGKPMATDAKDAALVRAATKLTELEAEFAKLKEAGEETKPIDRETGEVVKDGVQAGGR